MRGNAPGELSFELAGIPEDRTPRFRLLEPFGALPRGSPWPSPFLITPDATVRLRIEVPVADGVEDGQRLLALRAWGPMGGVDPIYLWLVVGGADLRPASMVASDIAPRVDQDIRIAIRVHNGGLVAAERFTVELLDNGEQVGIAQVSRLEAGQDTVVVVVWRAVEGHHTLTARVDPPLAEGDPWGSVAEANEADNEASLVVDVGGGSAVDDGTTIAGAVAAISTALGLAAIHVHRKRRRDAQRP